MLTRISAGISMPTRMCVVVVTVRERMLTRALQANLTTWEQAGYKFPRQRLVDNCKQ